MAGLDDDLEYLDEDEDIVQHYVNSNQPSYSVNVQQQQMPLLVERKPPRKTQKRKRQREEESDSEYDPSDDNPPSPQTPPSPPSRRRRVTAKKVKSNPVFQPQKKQTNKVSTVKENIANKSQPAKVKDNINKLQSEYLIRKKYNIRIPDYDDPLCLPVRAVKTEESDRKRLDNWNNVCLEHFKHCDMMLKSEQGETKKSVRSAVFRNVINNQTGNSETTIWSKTCVENEDGDKKSEIFQSVLPRYKEKKVLGNYTMINQKVKPFRTVSEVVLSKEVHKDGESLVVYKPKESLSAVYTLVEKRKTEESSSSDDANTRSVNDITHNYLKELTSCKVCAPCFHSSWRGHKGHKAKSLVCPMCARTFVSTYNLLAHFKSHSTTDVRRYKRIICKTLAGIVNYHYKCRICRKEFESIKSLRNHLPEHHGTETFKCEVGNHVVNFE